MNMDEPPINNKENIKMEVIPRSFVLILTVQALSSR